MKRHILSILLFAMSVGLWAQNPVEAVIRVEYTTEEGNDTVRDFSSIGSGTFAFVGGRGIGQHILNGELVDDNGVMEENQDLYAWTKKTEAFSVEIVINTMIKNSNIGIAISKKSINGHLDYEPMSSGTVSGTQMRTLQAGINGETSFLFDCENGRGATPYSYHIKFDNLGYNTKYYFQPFMILDGKYMWGEEKSFVTPRTIEGALQYDPAIGIRSSYDTESGICLSESAVTELLGKCGVTGDANKAQISNAGKMLFATITPDMKETLKSKATNTIECIDGSIYLVNSIPADILDYVKEKFAEPIMVSAEGLVNYDVDERGNTLYTKNCVNPMETVQCPEDSDVPFGKYLNAAPSTSNTNVSLGINTPTGLLPGEYTFSVTFAPDYVDRENKRTHRFYIYIFEQQSLGLSAGMYPATGVRMANPDGSGNYFLTDNADKCDTVSFDYTVSDSFAPIIIQFQSQVTSKLKDTYDRGLRVASIEVKPKK